MPIYADPAHGPEVRLLADEDMTMLATFAAEPPSTPGERPVARRFGLVQGIDPSRMARRLLQDLPGIRVLTDDPEAAAALYAEGADIVLVRRYLVRDLEADPPPVEWAAPDLPPGVTLAGPTPEDVADLEAVEAMAYPPGHVDHDEVAAAHRDGDMARLVAGRQIGPLLSDVSSVARDADGLAVAAVIATDWDGTGADVPWYGGPYIADVFRLPTWGGSGLGRALVRRALTVASLDGFTHIGLAVTAGNRAEALYEELGFREYSRKAVLDLPGSFPGQRTP